MEEKVGELWLLVCRRICTTRQMYKEYRIMYREYRIMYKEYRVMYKEYRIMYKEYRIMYKEYRIMYKEYRIMYQRSTYLNAREKIGKNTHEKRNILFSELWQIAVSHCSHDEDIFTSLWLLSSQLPCC